VDAIPEGEFDVEGKDVTIKEVLNDLTKKAHLKWTICAESIFVGTSEQIADIEKTTNVLKKIDSPILKAQLDKTFAFCTTDGTPLAEILEFVGKCGNMRFVVRSSIDDNSQRFGAFDFTSGIKMENFIRFLAVNWHLDVAVDKETIVFVQRRQRGGSPDSASAKEREGGK